MGKLLNLAYRNVFRFKRRTIITFSTVSLGLTLLIISISLLNGIDKQARDNIINSQTSHLTIFKKGYFEKKDDLPIDTTIKSPSRVQSSLKKIPGVQACESRIKFIGGLIKGMDELPIRGVAIEPELDPDVFNFKSSIVEGAWLEPGDTKILVGKNLADDVGLTVGDIVTIRMILKAKEEITWNAMDLEIKGIFDSGNPTVDNQWILLPLALAREGLSLEDEVTEIVIRLNSNLEGDIIKTRTKIMKMLESGFKENDLEIYSWEDLAGTFMAISKFKSKRSSMVVFIMLFIAGMGIINTMLMAVWERTREIGMLSAMGMKRAEIKKLFVFEGGLIGVFGSLLGCILGGLVGWHLEVNGFSLASMGESVKELTATVYPVKDVFYADLSMDLLIVTFILGTAVAVIASLYPAAKASKLNPINALRHI